MRQIKQFLARLRREPVFAAIFVITLALGVGANAALFSALHGYFLAPLPYPQSNRLMSVTTTGVYGTGQISRSTYDYLRRNSTAIAASGLSQQGHGIITLDGGVAQQVFLDATTASTFDALGVKPFLGRTLSADADNPHGPREVVLSYRFWENALHGNRGIVGTTLEIDAAPYTVVGVMPKGFYFPSRSVEFWLPINISPSELKPDRIFDMSNWLFVARLRQGVSAGAATRELNTLAQRQLKLAPADAQVYAHKYGYRVVGNSLRAWLMGPTGKRLLLIELGAALLLLLTAAILANLVTVRTLARRHETALRITLGASRLSLWRAALSYTLPLGLVGGLLSIGLAWWGTQLIADYGIGTNGTAFSIRPDIWVALFALALGCGVGALAALPAALDSRKRLLRRLSEGGRGDMGRRARVTQRCLSVLQIALGVALMTNALLLGLSFEHASSHPIGVTSAHLYIADLELHGTGFADQKSQLAFYQKFGAAVKKLPGIGKAGVASKLPFAGGTDGYGVDGVGGIETHSLNSIIEFVDGQTLQALGTQLVHGRLIDSADVQSKSSVAVIDTRLARALFGTTNVIGRDVKHNETYRIIGVTRPLRWGAHPDGEAGTMWLPYTVAPADPNYSAGPDMEIAVRSTLPEQTVKNELDGLLHRLAPNQAFDYVRSMRNLKSRAYHSAQALPTLFGLFSLLALLLAGVGTYGTVAYLIRLRLGEFAVRQAVGATPGRIGGLALAQGMVLAAFGIGIGIGGGLLLARALSGLVSGAANDTPLAYLAAALVMGLAALLATTVPAQRARRTDLLSLLRPQ